MAGLQTSVRYASDGSAAVWHIPFPFRTAADVGVKLIAADGLEQPLSYGKDYVINGSSVMCVVPAGCSIVLWLCAPLDDVLSASRSAALAPSSAPVAVDSIAQAAASAEAGLAEKAATLADDIDARKQQVDAAADAALGRMTAEADKLTAQVRQEAAAALPSLMEEASRQLEVLRETAGALQNGLRDEVERRRSAAQAAQTLATQAEQRLSAAVADINAARASVADAESRASSDITSAGKAATGAIQQAQETALSQIAAATASARRSAETTARLASGKDNAEALLVPDAEIKAGELIELPGGLAYFPGRGMLTAYFQGCALALGYNYEEVGEQDALSSHIRLTFALRPGDEVLFRVYATNSSADAELAAQRAERAAIAAAGDAADAAQSAAAAAEAAEDAGLQRWYAEKWAENSEISAQQSYGSAACAWQAAWQASIAAQPDRPGIAAVAQAGDGIGGISGMFCLIPGIRHSPTPFMGLWPAETGEIGPYDGFFFLGQPYDDKPNRPPLPPCPEPTPPEPPTDPEDPTDPERPTGSIVWGPCTAGR